MATSLLVKLGIEAANFPALSADLRKRVLAFLQRWEAYAEVLACLDAWQMEDLALVQDARAQALHGLGRTPEAIAILEARTAASGAITPRTTLARFYLAAGDTERALTTLRGLVEGDAGYSAAWYVLGDFYLQTGDLNAAEALFLRQAQLVPASRYPPIGLMQVHWQRHNAVTAAAYAVQALDVSDTATTLSVAQLASLLAFFKATADANHVREISDHLVQRHDREINELQSLLQDERKRLSGLPAPPPRPAKGARPAAPVAVGPPAAAMSSVAVPAEERDRLARDAREHFQFPALLPGQAEVISCVRRGEHVLAILPTGAGKSLCYQLPAFTGDGLTVVVSPLIALMKDQIDSLPDALRPQAIAINSSLDGDDLRRAVERIALRQYKLVYVAPERLRQLPFVHALRRAGLARLVIDEAHCVSVWGHDFRPDYLHIAQAHRELGAPPLLALTATAPPRVRQDIERQLFAKAGSMRVLAADTFRPNLHLSAFHARDDDEKLHQLVDLVRALQSPAGVKQTGAAMPKAVSGVVYVRSRQRCEELAALLRSQGVNAAHYHAGIANRSEVQDRFMRNEIAVIVATVAFGMGIDKPDIRFIIHYGLPNSVESYYQEAGRAGRDGAIAHCILLHNQSDRATLTLLSNQGQITVETARAIYRVVQQTVKRGTTGAIAMSALAQVTQDDETTARVALSLLEQAGLLQRHYDIPQTVTVQRMPLRGAGAGDATFDAFAQRAGLGERATSTYSLMQLADATATPPLQLEAQLLDWQDRGLLRYYPMGRLALISLAAQVDNAGATMESLISQRAAIAQQRIREIADYARTTFCRHGYLANYLGGQSRERCTVCDNCGAGIKAPASATASEFAAQATLVLRALEEQSWGQRSLVRLLRGDPSASDRAQTSRFYGALRTRSDKSVGQLIDSLAAEQLIAARPLDHGGVTLELTKAGAGKLRNAKA